MEIMDHEKVWLAEKYTARLNDLLVDGPDREQGGFPTLLFSLAKTAERIMELCMSTTGAEK